MLSSCPNKRQQNIKQEDKIRKKNNVDINHDSSDFYFDAFISVET